MKFLSNANPGFIANGILVHPNHRFHSYAPYDKYRNCDGLFPTVHMWRCVWRLVAGKTARQEPKDFAKDLMHIIDTNDNWDLVQKQIDDYRKNSTEFDKLKPTLLAEIVSRWKNFDIPFRTAKLQTIKNVVLLLFGISPNSISTIIDRELTHVKKRKHADMLLLLKNALLETNDLHVPAMPTLHELYKQYNEDPLAGLLHFKKKLYEYEIVQVVDMRLTELAKTNPPEPPPFTGSSKEAKKRKRSLITAMGGDNKRLLSLTDDQIDEASMKMFKGTWLMKFYNNEKHLDNFPPDGVNVLQLDRDTCSKMYRDFIDQRLDVVKDQIMFPLGNTIQQGTPMFSPRITLLMKCRHDQIKELCQNISDWQRIETDRVERADNKDIENLKQSGPACLPLQCPIVGGGKPLVQKYYINPKDDPNYDPPDLSPSGKAMLKMLETDYDEQTDVFTPTDLATRKKHLAIVAKDLEPFNHLSPKELADMFLKNAKKEYEFAKMVYERRKRMGLLKENNRKQEPAPPVDPELEINRQKLTTDAVVFLMNLEHLMWQHSASVALPMETMLDVHASGDSWTNPRQPKITFKGAKHQEAFEYLEEYINDTKSKAHAFRISLNEPMRQYDVPDKSKTETDNMLLFGDDLYFLRKDHEMIKEMSDQGACFTIYSKFPGFSLPPVPTEEQKEGIYYRMNISQPSVQYQCGYCSYTIFTHDTVAHDGEKVPNLEYQTFCNEKSFTCPMCNAGKDAFKQVWPTGARGYFPEPYKTVEGDEPEETAVQV